MQLNELSPAPGSKRNKVRVGRGFTRGKTCGRGHKGQKSRSGGKVRVGFEGGQMPLYMRVPKIGFTARITKHNASVRLSEINKIKSLVPDIAEIDLEILKAAGVVPQFALTARVFASGEITQPVILRGIKATKGAKEAIEKAGGKILEYVPGEGGSTDGSLEYVPLEDSSTGGSEVESGAN